MEWNELRLVLALCRSGSLSGAARYLGLNKSTVLRQINAVEGKMGVRFFERLSQGYMMTEAGEAVMRTAVRMEEEAIQLERELLGRDLRLQGDIRVTAPEGLAIRFLTPLISDFCKKHPEIFIDLNITNVPLALSRREADIAVRVTDKPPDTSLGRCISTFNFCAYAAPSYLKKHQDSKLSDHRWISVSDEVLWKKKQKNNAKLAFSCNSTFATLEAAKKGLGAVIQPCFLGDAEKSLRRLGPPVKEYSTELWVLTHPDLRHTARVRALMNSIYDTLKQKRKQFEG